MSKNLRYSLSLSRLPNDCRLLAKNILANEHCNNERSFLNSLLAYGFVNRRDRDCNFFTTSFIGNTVDEKIHQFSMPIGEENKVFVDHILAFKQGKLRTTEYNYLLFCGFNAFVEICKKYYFSEKYQLINLQNEIKNDIYSSGLYPFFLIFINNVEVKESEEKYYFNIYKTSINEMFSTNFHDFSDFVIRTCKSSDQSDATEQKQKYPVPVIEKETIQRVVAEKSERPHKSESKKIEAELRQSQDIQSSTLSTSENFTGEPKKESTPKIDDSNTNNVGQSSNSRWKEFKFN